MAKITGRLAVRLEVKSPDLLAVIPRPTEVMPHGTGSLRPSVVMAGAAFRPLFNGGMFEGRRLLAPLVG